MLVPVAAILGLASLAAAAPASGALSPDDVILLGLDGTTKIMKASEFDKLEARDAAPSQFSPRSLPASPSLKASHSRRGCEQSTEVQVLYDGSFLNWDVAISPVVGSMTSKGASVAVTDGYTLANTLSVSSTADYTFLKDVFKMSMSISYSETWTTQQSQTLSYQVPDDQYGVIVSQPYVHRITGNVLSGCTDSPKKDSFVSDTYTSQKHGDLSWVRGVIRLCSSKQYPIPFCIGNGSHA